MQQLLVVEQPDGGGKQVGTAAVDFARYHAHILVDGGGYDVPFDGFVVGYLCMQCGECQ